ncbi:MAG: DUF3108 domain-containing protein [Oleibacter sp.]|nr:DUF3108 domain-containing protein [Thalassolituus sp.]
MLQRLVFTLLLGAGIGMGINQTTHADTHTMLKPFTIDYSSQYKLGWFSIDIDATRQLSQQSDGTWTLDFNAEASVATVKENSQFKLSKDGKTIIPMEYRFRATGLISEDDRTLSFNAAQKTVKDKESDKFYDNSWQDGIQDNATYMLQASIALAEGKKEFSFPVFEKNKTKVFTYRVVSEDTVKIKAGTFDAYRVMQVRKDKDREIYAWFAKQDGFPMILLRDKKKGKLSYQIEASKLSF